MGKMDMPETAFTYQALVMRDPDASSADESFNAFALELDLHGVGPTVEAALAELTGNVEAQVEHAVDRGDLSLLDSPAPEEYQSIARELRAAHLRGEEVTEDRFVRSMPLPSARGSVHRPRARHAGEWSERELERLRAAPVPDEATAFDDEGGFVGHG